jgi:hypothetical protein
MIRITCSNPNCQKQLWAKDELAGRRTRCTSCGTILVIPQPALPPVRSAVEDGPDEAKSHQLFSHGSGRRRKSPAPTKENIDEIVEQVLLQPSSEPREPAYPPLEEHETERDLSREFVTANVDRASQSQRLIDGTTYPRRRLRLWALGAAVAVGLTVAASTLLYRAGLSTDSSATNSTVQNNAPAAPPKNHQSGDNTRKPVTTARPSQDRPAGSLKAMMSQGTPRSRADDDIRKSMMAGVPSQRSLGRRPKATVSDATPKSTALVAQDGTWSVDPVTITSLRTHYETDIRPGGFGGAYSIRPAASSRLVLLTFALEALAPDPDAVAKLAQLRERIQATINPRVSPGNVLIRIMGGVKLSAETRKQLEATSEHRIFEMRAAALVDSTGKRFQPVWCIAPLPEMTLLYHANGDLEHFSRNLENLPEHWAKTLRANGQRSIRANGTFAGLLETKRPVNVSLLYDIPNSIDHNDLSLKFDEGIEPSEGPRTRSRRALDRNAADASQPSAPGPLRISDLRITATSVNPPGLAFSLRIEPGDPENYTMWAGIVPSEVFDKYLSIRVRSSIAIADKPFTHCNVTRSALEPGLWSGKLVFQKVGLFQDAVPVSFKLMPIAADGSSDYAQASNPIHALVNFRNGQVGE